MADLTDPTMVQQDPDLDIGLDPTAPLNKAERLRKLADVLRNVQGPPSAAGTMVSGHYIAPSTSSLLAPMAAQLSARLKDSQADDLEKQAQQATLAAQTKFLGTMPQAVPGMPERDQQGPMDPTVAPGQPGNTPLRPIPAQAAQPVTRDAILKQTLAGMRNPATAGMAKVYGQDALKGVDAQDTRDFKDAELTKTLDQRAYDAQQNREMQMQNLRERLELQSQLGKDTTETKRMMANLIAQSSKDRTQAMIDIGAGHDDARRATAGAGKGAQIDNQIESDATKLSKSVEPLSPIITAARTVQDIIDKNTDPTTGKTASIPGFGYSGMLTPKLRSAEANKNASALQGWANAVLRQQAGLSQTLSETENQLLESFARGRGTQADFLAAWPNIQKKLNGSIDNAEAGHRPEAVQRYLERGGSLDRVYSKYDTAGQAKQAANVSRRAQLSGRDPIDTSGAGDDDLVNKWNKK